MMSIRTFTTTLLIAIGLCSTAIYTSCNKSTCSGVVCQNGGSCNNGSCSCPTGYSGTNCEKAATTSVAYVNNTFTPISIAINGLVTAIPVGGTTSFKGYYSTIASGYAYTSGSTPLGVTTIGGAVGQTINWQLNNNFPQTGTLNDTLNVGASYFYLSIVNRSSLYIIYFTVNGELTTGMLSVTATIPHDGQTYGLGYYMAYPNSTVEVTFSDGTKSLINSLSLPFVSNQSYVATFN